jgi:hypothetical protein
MAKITKPKKVKTEKQKLWDVRKDFVNNIDEKDLNPNAVKDFEDILKAMINHKPVKYADLKKKKKS